MSSPQGIRKIWLWLKKTGTEVRCEVDWLHVAIFAPSIPSIASIRERTSAKHVFTWCQTPEFQVSNSEVSLPKSEVLLLDTAQREDVCNQQERKKLPERRPTFNDLRNQVKELAQDYSFSEVVDYKHLPFEQCREVKLHIWARKLQSVTPELRRECVHG